MQIFGHRGVRKKTDADAPYQNTMEAIELAFEEGSSGIELDIVLSKDKEIFVIHDDNISKHSLNVNKKISELNTEEIEKIRVGNFNGKDGYRIPNLKDILKLFEEKFHEKQINIEIKYKGTSERLLEVLKEFKLNKSNIIVSSFDHDELRHFCDLESNIKVGILLDKKMLDRKSFEEHYSIFEKYKNIYSFNIEDVLLGVLKDKIRKLHKKIIVWCMSDNVPEKAYVRHIKDSGTNILITDYPKTVIDYN